MPKSPLSRPLARLALSLMGWRVQGRDPKLPASVVIGAPHTSNADFFLFLLVMDALGVEMHFLAKRSLFRFPLGLLFRLLGGRPIDRARRGDAVGAMIAELKERGGALALLPKGTRSKRPGWKSGFYHAALGAEVPLMMVSLNYQTKTAKLSAPLTLSGDVASDMAAIRAFYEGSSGRRPELNDVIRLDLEDQPGGSS